MRLRSHVASDARWSAVAMTSRFAFACLSVAIGWRNRKCWFLTYSPDCSSSYDLRFHCSSFSTICRYICMLHLATSTKRGHCRQKFSCLVYGLATLAADAVVVSFYDSISTVGCAWWIDRDVEGSNHAVVRYCFGTFPERNFRKTHWNVCWDNRIRGRASNSKTSKSLKCEVFCNYVCVTIFVKDADDTNWLCTWSERLRN